MSYSKSTSFAFKNGLFSEFLTHSEVLLSSHCQMFFVILLFFKTKYLCSSNNQITMCCVMYVREYPLSPKQRYLEILKC